MKSGVVVSLSGGLDSTVLLADCITTFPTVIAVSFDYGQRHRKELESAAMVARYYRIPHHIIDVQGVFSAFVRAGSTSSLLNVEQVPEGHYSHESMVSTIVPNRNSIFLSILTGVAVSADLESVAIATHNGDAAIYPDCRPPFIFQSGQAFRYAIDKPEFYIYTPFLYKSKANIVEIGNMLGAPMGLSWSCYEGGTLHCSKCGTCYERREAFEQAGIVDPTVYALSQSEWEDFKATHQGE